MDQTLPPKASDTEETDGLPLPRRIWAVVAISFALCMSVLDINIVNIVLPTLSPKNWYVQVSNCTTDIGS